VRSVVIFIASGLFTVMVSQLVIDRIELDDLHRRVIALERKK